MNTEAEQLERDRIIDSLVIPPTDPWWQQQASPIPFETLARHKLISRADHKEPIVAAFAYTLWPSDPCSGRVDMCDCETKLCHHMAVEHRVMCIGTRAEVKEQCDQWRKQDYGLNFDISATVGHDLRQELERRKELLRAPLRDSADDLRERFTQLEKDHDALVDESIDQDRIISYTTRRLEEVEFDLSVVQSHVEELECENVRLKVELEKYATERRIVENCLKAADALRKMSLDIDTLVEK